MTAPRWPAPGTTFGPDRLDEVRALLRVWPGRGVWAYGVPSDTGWYIYTRPAHTTIDDGETWHYVGPHPSDPPDTQPAETARTVEVSTWQYLGRPPGDGAWRACVTDERDDAIACRDSDASRGWTCGPVVEVRAALPLPVEPAVVAGEVSDAE